MTRLAPKIAALFLTVFAGVTLFMSSSVIFDWFGIREKEGNYVLFIVVMNFVCGFLYLFSAYGLFFLKKWSTNLLAGTAGILVLGFAALLYHINTGGLYEQQTLKAMLFRIGATILFAWLAWQSLSKKDRK